MKKTISILVLLALLLSLCACGKQPAPETQPSVVEDRAQTPEELYGHIDQFTPIDGVYKLWNAEGVKSIATRPDANYELLCTIDMGGETISPIGTETQPFTGDFFGANFFIKNFTVQGGSEESFGFFGVNEGTVRNLVIENVTFLPGPNAKNFGGIAGTNNGDLTRCTVSGAMTIATAPAGTNCGSIVGLNTGKVANSTATVDIAFNSPNEALVGGMIGLCRGGTIEYLETHGALDIAGANKTVGLFAGLTDTVFNKCVFSGSSNTVDGKLFNNFTGNPDDDELVVALDARWRDNSFSQPLPENIQAMRQQVVDVMNELCSMEWKVKQDLVHSCTCNLTQCHGTWITGFTYTGIPYNHKSSPLARAQYCIDADGYVQDWFYDMGSFDGFDMYFGGDCSSTLMQSWFTVSNSIDFQSTLFMPANYNRGTVKIGDYNDNFQLGDVKYTDQHILANGEQVMYQAYSQMRMGDAVVCRNENGGHTRMVTSDPVVVLDQYGNIDPNYSYFLVTEQGSPVEDLEAKTSSTCKVDFKRTFSNFYQNWYIPITCEELLTGVMETPEAKLEGGCGGYAGMFTGKVQANYFLVSVTLKVTDSQGNIIAEHPCFSNCQKYDDYGGNDFTSRNYIDHLFLPDLAATVSRIPFVKGETYSYTLTANLATFDDIQVHEGSFTFGA